MTTARDIPIGKTFTVKRNGKTYTKSDNGVTYVKCKTDSSKRWHLIPNDEEVNL